MNHPRLPILLRQASLYTAGLSTSTIRLLAPGPPHREDRSAMLFPWADALASSTNGIKIENLLLLNI